MKLISEKDYEYLDPVKESVEAVRPTSEFEENFLLTFAGHFTRYPVRA